MLMPAAADWLRIAECVGAKALRHGIWNEMLMPAHRGRAAAKLSCAPDALRVWRGDQLLGGAGGGKWRHGARDKNRNCEYCFPHRYAPVRDPAIQTPPCGATR